ncbi:hypothetical protein B0H16DRAFT_1461289 [Mycena metata]|uniref:Uncharacterized protein n=1 Tax=Mycena metata TaxID=1033252 RepID=A0AAD7N7P4_9AGAR|nr:hypothetical protein B0H16DRAFT_1461289 [Mycena metata]
MHYHEDNSAENRTGLKRVGHLFEVGFDGLYPLYRSSEAALTVESALMALPTPALEAHTSASMAFESASIVNESVALLAQNSLDLLCCVPAIFLGFLPIFATEKTGTLSTLDDSGTCLPAVSGGLGCSMSENNLSRCAVIAPRIWQLFVVLALYGITFMGILYVLGCFTLKNRLIACINPVMNVFNFLRIPRSFFMIPDEISDNSGRTVFAGGAKHTFEGRILSPYIVTDNSIESWVHMRYTYEFQCRHGDLTAILKKHKNCVAVRIPLEKILSHLTKADVLALSKVHEVWIPARLSASECRDRLKGHRVQADSKGVVTATVLKPNVKKPRKQKFVPRSAARLGGRSSYNIEALQDSTTKFVH